MSVKTSVTVQICALFLSFSYFLFLYGKNSLYVTLYCDSVFVVDTLLGATHSIWLTFQVIIPPQSRILRFMLNG